MHRCTISRLSTKVWHVQHKCAVCPLQIFRSLSTNIRPAQHTCETCQTKMRGMPGCQKGINTPCSALHTALTYYSLEGMQCKALEDIIIWHIQLLEYPIPALLCTSQKTSHGDISGTKSGKIDPLVSKRLEKYEKNSEIKKSQQKKTSLLRGSHGLSARRAWRSLSSRPEGPKAGPKGHYLEVGPQRGP